MASSSFDYGYMKMSTIQKPFNYPEPTRRLSWDDFSVFYQTANDWDYPIIDAKSEESNRSQNPSPKNDTSVNVHVTISPLSTGQHGSETDDVDTSASSMENISSCRAIKNGSHHLFKTQGARDSMEDDILDTSDDYADHDSSISIPHDDINMQQDENEYNDDAKINKKDINIQNYRINNDDMDNIDEISISLSNIDSNEDQQDMKNEEMEIECYNERILTRNDYTYYDKDTRLILMEIKVNDLNETVAILSQRIQELTQKNKYLTVSKLELVNNTANAMNQYRETIKKLNQQNNILLQRIKKI